MPLITRSIRLGTDTDAENGDLITQAVLDAHLDDIVSQINTAIPAPGTAGDLLSGTSGGVYEALAGFSSIAAAAAVAATALSRAEMAAGPTYVSRAVAEAATVPSSANVIYVYCGSGWLRFERKTTGTAMTTLGGVKWAPGDLFADPRHFGADETAVDNTAALQAWLNWIKSTGQAGSGKGAYDFTGTLTLYNVHDVKILATNLILNYVGTDTTIDLVQFGRSTEQCLRWNVTGITVQSQTMMTAGVGLLVQRINQSYFTEVHPSGQSGNQNLYHGARFSKCDTLFLDRCLSRAQKDGIQFDGEVGVGAAGYFLHGCKGLFCDVGLRIGGGIGGLTTSNCDFLSNAKDMVIDTTLFSEGNRELFFDAKTFFDVTTSGHCITISDTLAAATALFQFDGTWIASAIQDGLHIDTGVAATILVLGGSVFNCGRDGIRCESSTCKLVIASPAIRNNVTYGINFTVANANARVLAPFYSGNGTAYSPNVRPQLDIRGKVMTQWLDTINRYSETSALETVYACGDAIEGWERGAYRSRGTVAAPTALADGDNIGDLSFYGHDGTSWALGAIIRGVVRGSVSTGSVPIALEFLLRTSGGSTETPFAIRSNGIISAPNIPVYADNAAATSGGLSNGDIYRTSTGELRMKI